MSQVLIQLHSTRGFDTSDKSIMVVENLHGDAYMDFGPVESAAVATKFGCQVEGESPQYLQAWLFDNNGREALAEADYFAGRPTKRASAILIGRFHLFQTVTRPIPIIHLVLTSPICKSIKTKGRFCRRGES